MGSLRVPRVNIRSDRLSVQPLSIRQFNEQRYNILILRGAGGLGDILMHRMMFEDFKLLLPDVRITFACPSTYFPAVVDHPFVDEVVDFMTVDPQDFLIAYNTTSSCGRHECQVAPYADKHRSDIWAWNCGVILTKHNMHLRLTDEERKAGEEALAKYANGRKIVVLAPISAMESKNLSPEQMNGTARELERLGFSVVCLHNTPVATMKEAPVLVTSDIRHWMGIINAADAVVSVDTGTFHCAGGFKKPLVGIFTWADGLVYGKWFDFVLVQKHRSFTPGWGCGPCYKWHDCPMCPSQKIRKPCVTELSVDDIMTGVRAMFGLWPQLRPKGWPFSQVHNRDRLAPDPVSRDAEERVSGAVAVVKAGCSSVDRPATVELPVLQAIV